MSDENQDYPVPITIPPNVGKPGGPRFLDVLNFHLGTKLQRFAGKGLVLNKDTMEQMYELVAETVHGVFMHGSQNISEDARCWLAQRMYETIKIGDSPIITREEETWKHGVRPVYQKATLERVPMSDLRLIAGLFSEATFAGQIHDELKKRGAR